MAIGMKRRLCTPTLTRAIRFAWVPFCFLLMACHLDMYYQPKANTYEDNQFFKNGAEAQPLQADTVARDQKRDNAALYTGRTNGQLVTTIPITITEADLARGQERFTVFCAPCHGQLGQSNTVPGSLLNPHPPSFYLQRLRTAPDGHIFDV